MLDCDKADRNPSPPGGAEMRSESGGLVEDACCPFCGDNLEIYDRIDDPDPGPLSFDCHCGAHIVIKIAHVITSLEATEMSRSERETRDWEEWGDRMCDELRGT